LQAHLGHKNIQHTVRHTEPSPDRFKDFWRGIDGPPLAGPLIFAFVAACRGTAAASNAHRRPSLSRWSGMIGTTKMTDEEIEAMCAT
jgi:hypothetical protein